MNEKKESNGQQSTSLAVLAQGFVEQVTGRVTEMLTEGELQLPVNYSAPNALKSARLVLESVVDKNDNPALMVCTKDSVAHALLNMVVLGLNPSKLQCYFVVFGKSLVCLRSAKHGSLALVKRVLGEQAEVWDECVYEGDTFEYEIIAGRKKVTKHVQELANVDITKIVAAYAVLDPGDGKEPRTEIMTMAQIKKAWQQGAAKGDSPAHRNFTDEMCRKTVVNRLCKPIITSSDDSYLVKAFKEQEVAMAAAESEAVADAEANATVMDFDERQVPVVDQGEPVQPEPVVAEVVQPAEPEPEPEPEPAAPVDESVVPAPKTLFNNFIDDNELDPSLARKVAANMSKLDDVRKLSNADYVDVLSDMDAFLEQYQAAQSNDAQPSLTGTL